MPCRVAEGTTARGTSGNGKDGLSGGGGWEEKGLESKQRHLRSLSGVMGAKIETIEQVTKRGYGKSNQIKKRFSDEIKKKNKK